MKESLWAYFVLLFGVFIIVIMMIIRDYQTTNDEDYYLIKEITKSAMIDAVDYSYYRDHNDLKIIEDKFAENFLRRFAQSMDSNKNYKIQIFDVSENPPKVSIKVSSSTSTYKVDESEGTVDFGVVNLLSAILDMKHDNVVFENDRPVTVPYNTITRNYYTIGYSASPSGGSSFIDIAKLPKGLDPSDIISITAEPSSITNKKDYQNYLVDKLNGVMVWKQDRVAFHLDFPTNWDGIKNSSFYGDSIRISTNSAYCDDKCHIRYSYTVTNPNAAVKTTEPYHDDKGYEVVGVYFFPIKFKVTFTYR